MKFNIKKWREFYDEIHELGKRLKDSYPTIDENEKTHDALINLSTGSRLNLILDIKDLIEACRIYLDACGLKITIPLWKYDIKDKTTWVSDESFKYNYLLLR